MNIYSKKRSWKVFLLVLASIIVAVSLWYTNGFIHKLGVGERSQVELWAKAISRKADLVNYTQKLFENLSQKEKRYVYLWTEATKKFITADPSADIKFYTDVISGNEDIPVIVTDSVGSVNHAKNLDKRHQNITHLTPENASKFTDYAPIKALYFENQYNYIYYRNSKTFYQLKNTLDDLIQSFVNEIVNNSLATPVIITDSTQSHIIAFGGALDSLQTKDTLSLLKTVEQMRSNRDPIKINLAKKGTNYIFYDESPTLTQMRYFPAVLFSAIALFLLIGYVLFSISRKGEQSKVWAGMAKETAHQLGTPISSLMGWVEVMKLNHPEELGLQEMDKDIERLKLVSERFSKIGSIPELEENNIIEILHSVTVYMQRRAPKRIEIILLNDRSQEINLLLNKHLIIWVFENLLRNAVDAIGTDKGRIKLYVSVHEKEITIDISDTGKGIPKSQQRTIFNPGYSTKSRGWGLGLSLAKRIIVEYHRGKIFVKNSTIGEGTVFRVVLKK